MARYQAPPPQANTEWCALFRLGRIWVGEEGQTPRQPWITIIVEPVTGVVLALEVAEAQPTSGQTERLLRRAMLDPDVEDIPPHRPKRIVVSDPEMAQRLSRNLRDWGVAVEAGSVEAAETALKTFEDHSRGDGPQIAGALSVKGVTPEQLGALWSAAADFWRAEPWAKLENIQPVAIAGPDDSRPRIVVVLGNAGMEFGLSVYSEWADLERHLYGQFPSRDATFPTSGQLALWFGTIDQVPFDDLDLMRTHDWPVAHLAAYPMPVRLMSTMSVERPGPDDIAFLTVACRLLAKATTQLLSTGQGDWQPISVRLEDTDFVLTYPAGAVDYRQQPVHSLFTDDWDDEADDLDDLEDWEDEGDEPDGEHPALPEGFSDPREFEKLLSKLQRVLGNEIGRRPAETDPRRVQARALLESASNSEDPAEQRSLIRQALDLWPDYVDAHIELAELANTLGDAETHWQHAVEAGRRHLGLDSDPGREIKFWLDPETRPYMRALAGLVNINERLRNFEAALAGCRELLLLDPDDHQGQRFVLLRLLMSFDRDDEAASLIERYPDDMADTLYTSALLNFRRHGRGDTADRALKKALRNNRHVSQYLLGQVPLPSIELMPFSPGDEMEAINYASAFLNAWRRTPKARDWLREFVQRRRNT